MNNTGTQNLDPEKADRRTALGKRGKNPNFPISQFPNPQTGPRATDSRASTQSVTVSSLSPFCFFQWSSAALVTSWQPEALSYSYLYSYALLSDLSPWNWKEWVDSMKGSWVVSTVCRCSLAAPVQDSKPCAETPDKERIQNESGRIEYSERIQVQKSPQQFKRTGGGKIGELSLMNLFLCGWLHIISLS